MNIIASIFLAFLPKRYRDKFLQCEILPAGVIISGALESLFSLYLLVVGYHSYVQERVAQISATVLTQAGEKGGETAIMGLGTIFLLEYLIHISAIVLIFFLVEGIVRMSATIVAGEVVPTLPLKIVEVVQQRFVAQRNEKRMGERIRDEVTTDEGSDTLRIASCRPKPWTNLTTISHEGALYELATQGKADAPRPFVYVLRRKPVTAVIRGICAYDPEEALLEER